jgi:hypothetical protein
MEGNTNPASESPTDEMCPKRAAAMNKEEELDRDWEDWMQTVYRKVVTDPGDLSHRERSAIQETDAQLRLTDYTTDGFTPAVKFRAKA